MPLRPDQVLIKACLNGARGREDNPNVPWTPREVADEAVRARDAGAAIVHFHARHDDGRPSYDAAWYEETDRLIRDRSDVILNHTTIRPASVPLESVLAYLRGTSQPVDMVSLVIGSMQGARKDPATGKRTAFSIPNTWDDIAALLDVCYERGIRPEPAYFDLGMLSLGEALLADRLLRHDDYFLLEPTGHWGDGRQLAPGGRAESLQLLDAVQSRHLGALCVLHGSGPTSFTTATLAVAAGAHVRVGFEDSPRLPGDDRPSSNAAFVEWAVALARMLGRQPATPAEVRALLDIPVRA
jgi:3-keto-5-aminohexanoate cleavage enzyme